MRNYTRIKNARRSSFLIGDSESEGKDQIASASMGYADKYTFAELNARKLEKAKAFIESHRFANIRIVTVYYDGICNRIGIIDYIETKRTTKPFDFDKANEID